MKIISHRGLWTAANEQNTRAAFDRTLANGFGTETDVRDAAGRLVVSHDPPSGNMMVWDDVVDLFDGSGLPLAVNVKADGLVPLLADAFRGRAIDWFAFDMSGPQVVQFARAGLPFYTRHSDVEPEPILYSAARGVWLDAFEETWFNIDQIAAHRRAGKAVCVVSSELHGREPRDLWSLLSSAPVDWDVTLCTDRPHEAREFFGR